MRVRLMLIPVLLVAVAGGLACGHAAILSKKYPMIVSLNVTSNGGTLFTANVGLSAHTEDAILLLSLASVDSSTGSKTQVYSKEVDVASSDRDESYQLPFSASVQGEYIVTSQVTSLDRHLMDSAETTFIAGAPEGSTEASTTTTSEAATGSTSISPVPPTTPSSGSTTISSSAATPPQPNVNGHWTGNFTYTSVHGAPNYKTGMPLPMTLDITLDSQGRGETVMFIDGSAMGQPGKPGTVSASYQGDTLTFTIPSGKDYSATMSGQVSSDGSQLVIKGTYSYTSPPSVLMTAEWQVTR